MPLDTIVSEISSGLSLDSISWLTLLKSLGIFLVGILLIKLLLRTVDRLLLANHAIASIRTYLRSTISVVLWTLLILVVLGVLGVPTGSLIALFSVAGLAISLALQNTLSNLAGGIMILVTKPFVVGDYVDLDTVSGTVSAIGLVYSTLVTVENKQVYIPNSQVSSTKIINYTSLGQRRMELTISASYDASTQQVKDALWEALNQFPQILKDPAPVVWLSDYGESSIQYIIRAWTSTEDYWGVYYRLLEAVRPAFDRHHIEMNYPHLNVHLPEQSLSAKDPL